MPNQYYDPEDPKRLKDLKEAAPKDFAAWHDLNAVVGREDGAIPRKYRELIALAVANTTQCVFCIEAHARAAKEAGATREEVAEAVFLAAALRAGGAVGHGVVTMKLYDEAQD
jgi:AhpD family alkylhydroperoxidase